MGKRRNQKAWRLAAHFVGNGQHLYISAPPGWGLPAGPEQAEGTMACLMGCREAQVISPGSAARFIPVTMDRARFSR